MVKVSSSLHMAVLMTTVGVPACQSWDEVNPIGFVKHGPIG